MTTATVVQPLSLSAFLGTDNMWVLMNPSHVLIFVEGDTDEVFYKAFIYNKVEKITEVLLFCENIANFARKSVREWAAPLAILASLW